MKVAKDKVVGDQKTDDTGSLDVPDLGVLFHCP